MIAEALALSAALWRWHPWDVSRKWSLYLHALSAVLALRIVADIALHQREVPATRGEPVSLVECGRRVEVEELVAEHGRRHVRAGLEPVVEDRDEIQRGQQELRLQQATRARLTAHEEEVRARLRPLRRAREAPSPPLARLPACGPAPAPDLR